MALHKYLVLNFIYFIRSKEPLLAEQSLWGVKRLAFAVFNVLQSYRLPSFTCATVRNMFYSGDLLSPKGALGQIWVCVFISDVALAPFFLDNFLKVPFPFTARPKCNSNCALNSFSILLYASDTRASAGMCQSSYATQSSADIRTCSMWYDHETPFAPGEFTGSLLMILCASCLMASLLLSSGPATCRASNARCCHPLLSTTAVPFWRLCNCFGSSHYHLLRRILRASGL